MQESYVVRTLIDLYRDRARRPECFAVLEGHPRARTFIECLYTYQNFDTVVPNPRTPENRELRRLLSVALPDMRKEIEEIFPETLRKEIEEKYPPPDALAEETQRMEKIYVPDESDYMHNPIFSQETRIRHCYYASACRGKCTACLKAIASCTCPCFECGKTRQECECDFNAFITRGDMGEAYRSIMLNDPSGLKQWKAAVHAMVMRSDFKRTFPKKDMKDMKIHYCPMCYEPIQSLGKLCRYCFK